MRLLKHLVCVVAMTFFVATFMVAQSTAEIQDRQGYYLYSQHDTISTSSSTHVFQFTLPERLYKNMDCVVSIVADSLSGGTTATFTIQESADPDGVNWQDVGSAVTINGVQTKNRQTFQLVGTRLRGNVDAPSSTQSTRVRFECACKKRFRH
jgi:alpha-L-fucosidase